MDWAHQEETRRWAESKRPDQLEDLSWNTLWLRSNQISEIKALMALDQRCWALEDNNDPTNNWEMLSLIDCPKTQSRHQNWVLKVTCYNLNTSHGLIKTTGYLGVECWFWVGILLDEEVNLVETLKGTFSPSVKVKGEVGSL